MKLGACLVMLVAAIGLSACGGGSAPVAAKSPNGYGPSSAPQSADAPEADYAAPSRVKTSTAELAPAAPPSSRGEAMSEAPAAGARPGLGTEWGETRYSHVSHTSFDRANANHPTEIVSLFYNDREGARAMARYADYREVGDAVAFVSRLGIRIALNDEYGAPLPAFFAGGRTYAIGEAGQRYTVVVTNESGVRVEAVASVDGLDVLDGKGASFDKRGYLVPAWGSVEIEGFRQTSDHVAAFRFGSVRDSYAARTGSDRNVGIVGVAIFAPRHAPSFPWTNREVERRRTADPFPGSYASPPPPRW
ncbi:MAG: hypothetical protein ABW133_22705 [Polyangiaceae bacterium]